MSTTYVRHAHDGGTVHNHRHMTTTTMRASGAEHSHRMTYRSAWVGCDCDRCRAVRARTDPYHRPIPVKVTR